MTNPLRNEKILLIGFPAWEGDYLKSTVQLATELAANNDVLYVEYPFTWKDVAMARLGKSKAPWRRILGKEQRLRRLPLNNGASINVLTLPPVAPVNFINNEMLYDALMQGNAQRACQSIRAAMQSLGMERPVVINAFNPFLGVFLARQFDEKALIYYCYDEISAAKWAGKHGARLERRLMRQADAVVTSSQPLFEAKQPFANLSFLVKNGVDFDLFHQQQGMEGVTAVPACSSSPAQQPKPNTIGYLGSLDERVDFDLLESTIAALPHRQFCFVGRVNSPEAGRLLRYANVRIMGTQPADSLPGWVRQFDVCMIPFLKNELTAGIYPLKINEYFACGKPVVATGFGDLSDFKGLIGVANSPGEFAALLEASLRPAPPALAAARVAFARGNSWQQRAAELGQAIATVLHESHRPEWMPDNYNRWGAGSAPFFSGREQLHPTETNSAALSPAWALAARTI